MKTMEKIWNFYIFGWQIWWTIGKCHKIFLTQLRKCTVFYVTCVKWELALLSMTAVIVSESKHSIGLEWKLVSRTVGRHIREGKENRLSGSFFMNTYPILNKEVKNGGTKQQMTRNKAKIAQKGPHAGMLSLIRLQEDHKLFWNFEMEAPDL